MDLRERAMTAIAAVVMVEPADEVMRLLRILHAGANVEVSFERTDGFFEAQIADRTLVISRKLLDVPDRGEASRATGWLM